MDILNGIWIIDPNGLCLLHRDFSMGPSTHKIDETMFSGFLTAILSFTQDLVKDTIEKISMGEREIHYQSFNIFAVAVSANKSKKNKQIPQYITKVGEAFMKDYGEELRTTSLQNREKFSSFGEKIDDIFGLKGVRVALEQRTNLLDILTKLKNDEISADEGVTKILALYHELDGSSKKFMKKALKDVEGIFKKSELLTPEQRKQFQSIVKEVGSQLKAEKWLSSF